MELRLQKYDILEGKNTIFVIRFDFAIYII